jgi:tight adherence protein B
MLEAISLDLLYAFGLSAIFVGLFLSSSALYAYVIAPSRYRKSLRQRVESIKTGGPSQAGVIRDTQMKGSLILKVLEKLGGRHKLEDLQTQLLQADVDWDPTIFLGLVVLLGLLGFIIGNLKYGLLGGLAGLPLTGLLPFLYLRMMKKKKSAKIEAQMPDVMELLARSLRAGHTLPSAIELAGKESPDPLGTELRIVYEEQRLGLGLSKALEDMVKRVDSRDLRYFVTGVLIQAETGGSLAELMEKIGHLIRERLKLKMKIQALTAEGRISAIVLEILPVGIFLFLYFFQYRYIQLLFTDPLGAKMLAAAIFMMVLGHFCIRRIIRIDV